MPLSPASSGSFRTFVMRTPSMSPLIRPGDVVVVESVAPAAVRRGDIIAFTRPDLPAPVAHKVARIVWTDGAFSFETRSHVCTELDLQPVRGEQLVGRVSFWQRGELTFPYLTLRDRWATGWYHFRETTGRWGRFVWVFRRDLSWLWVLLLISPLLSVIWPYFTRPFVDYGLVSRDWEGMVKTGLAGALFFVLSQGFSSVQQRLNSRISENMTKEAARRAMIYLLHRPFLDDRAEHSGERLSFLLSDIENVGRLLVNQIPGLLQACLSAVFSLSLAWWMDPRLALALTALGLLLFLMNRRFGAPLRISSQRAALTQWNLARKLQDLLARLELARLCGAEEAEARRFLSCLELRAEARVNLSRVSLLSSRGRVFLTRLIGGGLAAAGFLAVIEGRLTPGTLAAFLAYAGIFLGSVSSLSDLLEQLVRDRLFTARFLPMMDFVPETPAAPGRDAPRGPVTGLALAGATFSYQPDHPVLRQVSHVFPIGKWTGLVGPSGCGKTTLLRLLVRLLDPQEGAVRVSNKDAREWPHRELRSRVLLVNQEPMILNSDFADNIAYGDEVPDEGRLLQAARDAALDDFIDELPDGYRTKIGERGNTLSQGQCQRLALARAFYRDPEVLLLDEALSSVDERTESIIYARLRARRQGRTTLMVTHRSSSLVHCDEIVRMGTGGALLREKEEAGILLGQGDRQGAGIEAEG